MSNIQSKATKRLQTGEKPSRPNPLAKKILKIVLIILAVLFSVVLIVVIAGFIFASVQKPIFVNKDLGLANKLYIPELLQPRIENGEKVFDLTVQQGEKEFLPGKQTKT